MAESKRAAATDAETWDLPIPPFDAEAYVRKEAVGSRATLVLAIYGVLLGQLGALLPNVGGPLAFMKGNNVASLGIFFFGLVGLQGLLEVCGVSTKEWDRKTWAGHVIVLFFTWLAAWILFQNPPFLHRAATPFLPF